MKTVQLTALTMLAFAMNSVLNRAAVDAGHADPHSFAVLRVLSGALILSVLVYTRARSRFELLTLRRWGGGIALAIYMIGFSRAYISLDAGLGALILFGTVQIGLFVHASATGVPPTRMQLAGAAIAFAGLVIALLPNQAVSGSAAGAVFMVLAGLGWAAYTIAGRTAPDPIGATASHFLLCLPFISLLLLSGDFSMTVTGAALAVLCGAVTSGLGYALWYRVLPSLPGVRAAVVQLSVPVIAILLGSALLGEALSAKVSLAALLVVGGIALALFSAPKPLADRK